MSVLRVAVIGYGGMGRANAKAVTASSAATLAGIVDARPIAAQEATRLGVPFATDIGSLLERAPVDAAIVSVPHDVLARIASAVADLGLHALVEKPGGLDVEEVRALVERCASKDVLLTANYWYRQVPAIQLARDLVREGAIGTLYGADVRVHQHKDPAYWAGDEHDSGSDWRAQRARSGGGMLIMTTCHAVDAVRYVTGENVHSPRAELHTSAAPGDVEDGAAITFRVGEDAIGSLATSSVVRGVRLEETTIWGSHGTMTFDRTAVRLYSTRRTSIGRPGRHARKRTEAIDAIEAVRRVIDELAAAAAGNAQTAVQPDDIIATMRFLDDAYADALRARER